MYKTAKAPRPAGASERGNASAMIYQRLTIRTCARYAAVVSPAVTLITGLVFFSRLLGDAAEGSIPTVIIGQLFLLTLLKYAPQLLILSAFAGVFLAMRRAFAQNEMDVWFSCGLGLTNFIKPVLLFALPAALFVGVFSLYIAPWSVHTMNNVRLAAAFDIDVNAIPQQRFGTAPGKSHSYYLDGESLFIGNNSREEVIFAHGIHRESETALRLIDGNLFYLTTKQGNDTLEQMRFGSLRLSLPAANAANIRPRAKSLAALRWDNARDRAELAWRIALPLATIVLVLCALFLSQANSPIGRRFGFFSAIAVFFVYLNMLRFMRDQIANDAIPLGISLLLPPLLAGGIVLVLARLFRR